MIYSRQTAIQCKEKGGRDNNSRRVTQLVPSDPHEQNMQGFLNPN